MKTKSDRACIGHTIKIIGSKWTILLLQELCHGTKRFGELEKALAGISPRTLSLRLKQLEKDHIIHKRIFEEVPLHVEYSLTAKGSSLRDIIDDMCAWGEKSR